MNVDPLLQEVLDHHVKIASATFAKEEDRQTLIDTALLTFAGLGLAELAKDETGRIVWMQSERLMEKSRSGLIDLSQFMEPPAFRQDQPKMTQSLRLIVDDIIKVKQQKHPGWSNINTASVLLGLAGWKMAEMRHMGNDNYIWTATPELILYYAMGKGIEGIAARRKQKVKMDAVLKTISHGFGGLSNSRFGPGLPGDLIKISSLLMLEWQGDAVAEIDRAGKLAWRASNDLKSDFAESEE